MKQYCYLGCSWLEEVQLLARVSAGEGPQHCSILVCQLICIGQRPGQHRCAEHTEHGWRLQRLLLLRRTACSAALQRRVRR